MLCKPSAGPWTVGIGETGDSPTFTVRAPSRGVLHWGENDANAYLISCAPDLLELVIQYRNDLLHPPAPDSVERRLQAIGRVLAKVEGVQ